MLGKCQGCSSHSKSKWGTPATHIDWERRAHATKAACTCTKLGKVDNLIAARKAKLKTKSVPEEVQFVALAEKQAKERDAQVEVAGGDGDELFGEQPKQPRRGRRFAASKLSAQTFALTVGRSFSSFVSFSCISQSRSCHRFFCRSLWLRSFPSSSTTAASSASTSARWIPRSFVPTLAGWLAHACAGAVARSCSRWLDRSFTSRWLAR
jgi:hypothetical protein